MSATRFDPCFISSSGGFIHNLSLLYYLIWTHVSINIFKFVWFLNPALQHVNIPLERRAVRELCFFLHPTLFIVNYLLMYASKDTQDTSWTSQYLNIFPCLGVRSLVSFFAKSLTVCNNIFLNYVLYTCTNMLGLVMHTSTDVYTNNILRINEQSFFWAYRFYSVSADNT